MRNNFLFVFIFALLSIVAHSCKKDGYTNPYDDASVKPPVITYSDPISDPNSFAYIYKNVLKPTCANSGCHDGSFEPDCRSMNSAYNTLTYRSVISNDTNSTFKYRVVPYNSSLSLIWKRMTQEPYGLIGQGRMPWNNPIWKNQPQNAVYIQNIVNWINGGAKDMFGNIPTLGNKDPKTMGLLVFPSGNTSSPYSRVKTDPINIPNGTLVDFWISISDDSTSAQNMVVTDLKISTKGYDFSGSVSMQMLYSTPISGTDFFGATASYTHKLASFNTAPYPVGTILFVRTYLRDTSHATASELPGNNSSEDVIKYFTIKII